MPCLLVLRHGKSDWDADFATDADRPLATRGRRAAATIGRHLAATGPVPDLALTSPARRARDTLTLTADAMGWGGPTRIVDALYGRGPAAVLDELRTLGPGEETVMIVGHEPTWSSLIGLLSGVHVRFPTAALALLDLADGGWVDMAADSAELVWLVTPRELESSGAPGGGD